MLTQSAQTKRILLVEKDSRYRDELKTLLSRNYTVVGEANSVESAIYFTVRYRPDVMLLDMKLEGGDGIALLHQLQKRREKVKPLVLSAHQEISLIKPAMDAGARGYMFKFQVAKQLEDAITTVLQGQVYMSSEATTVYFKREEAATPYKEQFAYPTFTPQAKTPCLSNREQQVLQLAAFGASNEKIAQDLHISLGTVKLDFKQIFYKLEVPGRTKENSKANWEVNSRARSICIGLRLGLIHMNNS